MAQTTLMARQYIEKAILDTGRVTPENLLRYKARAATEPQAGLLNLLVADGVLTAELAAEIRNKAARPSSQAAVTGPQPRARGRLRFQTEVLPALRPPPAAPSPALPPTPPPAVPAAPEPAPAHAAVAAPAPVPAPPAAPAAPHGEAEVCGEDAAPEGWPQGVAPVDARPGNFQDYLRQAEARNASDLHLNPTMPPMCRVHGSLVPLKDGHPPFTAADTERIVQAALTPAQWACFERTGDLDLCYSYPGGGRYRTNVFRERNGLGIKTRLIRAAIPKIEELGLPPHCKRLTEYAQGLVLITGPTGHGKTTTMMALVDMVNQARPDHIITVEDPIEYVLTGAQCQVSQRAIGAHTASFATALKAALRENPDIIVVGDLRDYEATSMAISAAETGHLVFASLPTQDAARTIDKVLDYFPPDEQTQIRLMVSESLRGILSQQLVPRKDGQGRVAAVELLFNSVAVANIIRDANTAGLTNAMQLGKNLGMVLMDESLKALVDQGAIAGEEAWARATNKALFAPYAPARK
ncbi:MAG: PilT/PilU family type 4a pilus ATPase [Planctomycetota bacterium]